MTNDSALAGASDLERIMPAITRLAEAVDAAPVLPAEVREAVLNLMAEVAAAAIMEEVN